MKARESCNNRGYEVISFEVDGWYIFLKKDDVVIPVTEEAVNQWVVEDYAS